MPETATQKPVRRSPEQAAVVKLLSERTKEAFVAATARASLPETDPLHLLLQAQSEMQQAAAIAQAEMLRGYLSPHQEMTQDLIDALERAMSVLGKVQASIDASREQWAKSAGLLEAALHDQTNRLIDAGHAGEREQKGLLSRLEYYSEGYKVGVSRMETLCGRLLAAMGTLLVFGVVALNFVLKNHF